ncbi:MAG: Flp pilus assembly protein CpaB [Halobacteriovoraceae bacterium]|nr:Flp pilus assembly protein CpaB [Halobacteriovoraceae bacterium]
MNSRAFTLSLLIAGIAMFMAYSYIDSKESEFIKIYGNPQPVVIASTDIRELELIDDTKVRIVNIPKKFAMPGHIKKIEEVINTIATVPIKKDEQITKPRVTQPGARTGLANQISVGKRAYAVNVSASQAVGKLLKPGDRVDVLSIISYAPGQVDKMKVKTVLQDVYVLSTGLKVTNALPLAYVERNEELRRINLNRHTDYNTVTLELSPHEIQKLVFLINSGSRIHLSLRNGDDKTVERLPATQLYDVLGEDAGEARNYYKRKNESNKQRIRR